MNLDVDFVIESPHSNERLLVEAKSINSSAEDAVMIARNLLRQTPPDANDFLLLVLRDHLYLWKHTPKEGSDLPDFSGRTEEVFEPYLRHVQTPLRDLHGLSFELLVRSWLMDLSDGMVPSSSEEWLRAAGLQQFEHGLLREAQRN